MLNNFYDVEKHNRFQYEYNAYMAPAILERDLAYKSYHTATRYLTTFDYDRSIFYANNVFAYLRDDEKWVFVVKSDKLQKKAQSLLNLTLSVRDFHKWRFEKGEIKYFD
jgi:hypothetical protein